MSAEFQELVSKASIIRHAHRYGGTKCISKFKKHGRVQKSILPAAGHSLALKDDVAGDRPIVAATGRADQSALGIVPELELVLFEEKEENKKKTKQKVSELAIVESQLVSADLKQAVPSPWLQPLGAQGKAVFEFVSTDTDAYGVRGLAFKDDEYNLPVMLSAAVPGQRSMVSADLSSTAMRAAWDYCSKHFASRDSQVVLI